MAFSIDNLLKHQPSTNEDNPNNPVTDESSAIGHPSQTTFGITDNGSVPVAFMQNPALTNQQLPTLADLQLLFGGGGPKAHYRRNRRSGADRKPRQAYSSKQLEKLEDEFKKDKYLSVSKRVELSKTLNLSETQIKTWFQNRRTKWKKQVTASLRQLYRHGLYSQYAAVAAASNPPCFLPMLTPTGGLYENMPASMALDHQPNTSVGQIGGVWNTQGNLILGFPEFGSAMVNPMAKELIGRSNSANSSCSSEASNLIV